MDNISKETKECSKISASNIVGVIKRTMEREYARDLAGRIISGDGIFLDLDQIEEIRSSLSKVTAMVSLVANGARVGETNDNLSRDAHIAMLLASEELGDVVQTIEESMNSKHQGVNSPGIRDGSS